MKFESIVKITTGVGLALLAGMATIQTVKEYRTKTGIFEEETETVEEVDTTEETEQSEGPDVEIVVNKPKFFNKETLIKTGIIAALSLVAGFVIAVKMVGEAAGKRIKEAVEEAGDRREDEIYDTIFMQGRAMKAISIIKNLYPDDIVSWDLDSSTVYTKPGTKLKKEIDNTIHELLDDEITNAGSENMVTV